MRSTAARFRAAMISCVIGFTRPYRLIRSFGVTLSGK